MGEYRRALEAYERTSKAKASSKAPKTPDAPPPFGPVRKEPPVESFVSFSECAEGYPGIPSADAESTNQVPIDPSIHWYRTHSGPDPIRQAARDAEGYRDLPDHVHNPTGATPPRLLEKNAATRGAAAKKAMAPQPVPRTLKVFNQLAKGEPAM